MASFSWPSTTGGSSSNASIGPNGSTAPTSSTEVAGINPSGNLQPFQLDGNGNLLVSPNVNISSYGGTATTLGQTTSSASIPVVIALDQSTLPISAASLPLPTGASTSALQTSGNTSLTSILANQTNGTQTTSVLNFPATQPISGTVTVVQLTAADLNATVTGTVAATQSGTWNITNISGTISLPTGASTSDLQTTGNTSLATIATNTTGASTAANQSTIIANQTNGNQLTQVEPKNGTLTDNSGSTSGTPSTSTTLMSSNASRRYLLIENIGTSNIYINFTSAATVGAGSFELVPTGSLVQEAGFVSTEAVTVISASASVPYTAKQA